MEITGKFLSYKKISNEWERSVMNSETAKILTLGQVEAFEKIVSDDEAWKLLLSVFNRGRDVDAWLASDWPDGFDELLLCVPLCKLVQFECSRCTVGRRQENNSCAYDYSLFGYIAELLKIPDRAELTDHLKIIKKILLSEEYKWNISMKKLEEI